MSKVNKTNILTKLAEFSVDGKTTFTGEELSWAIPYMINLTSSRGLKVMEIVSKSYGKKSGSFDDQLSEYSKSIMADIVSKRQKGSDTLSEIVQLFKSSIQNESSLVKPLTPSVELIEQLVETLNLA